MIRIPHLETDITTACQLSCVSCNHMVPIWRKIGTWKANPEQVKKDLNHLSTILHADGWGALGGEPTLSNDLIPILKIVRQSGICDKIEVWTNGMRLVHMYPTNHEFWRHLDVLVVSRYEGKLSDGHLEIIDTRCAVNEVELVVKDERTWHNFRTNLEPIPTGPEETQVKFDRCFFRQFSRVANNGYFYLCCCVGSGMPRLLQSRPEGSDGIPIEGLTEEALQAYLTRTEPLGCCTICAGRDTAKPIEWQEERDPEKWLQKSKGL